MRDFLDVRDIADAYLALASSEAEGVINVCSGRGVELAELVRQLTELSSAHVEVEEDQRLYRRDDPPTVIGHPSHLHSLVDWGPRRSMQASLADVLNEWRRREGTRTSLSAAETRHASDAAG